jgi:hypothetical protein
VHNRTLVLTEINWGTCYDKIVKPHPITTESDSENEIHYVFLEESLYFEKILPWKTSLREFLN